MSTLTTAGENYLAAKNAAQEVPVVVSFVYANINGLDTSVIPPKSELMPGAGDIVDEQPVTSVGRVNDNQVVHSNILPNTLGGYDYNWVGLKTDDDTLLSVLYTPLQKKHKRDETQIGDNQNWNFITEYNGLAELAQIDIAAESWQLDTTTRLEKMDGYSTSNMQDLFGAKAFIGNAFKIYKEGDDYKAMIGVGYAKGLRVELDTEVVLSVESTPSVVFIDAFYEYIALDRVIKFDIKTGDELPDDYIDGHGIEHKVVQIASLLLDGTVDDDRIIISENPSGQIKQSTYEILTDAVSDKTLALGKVIKVIDSSLYYMVVAKDTGVMGTGKYHDMKNDLQLKLIVDEQADDVTDLRLKKAKYHGQVFNLMGHSFSGRGNGSLFADFNDTTTPDNNGSVFENAEGVRLKRFSGYLMPSDFGVIHNDETPSVMANNLIYMQAFMDATDGGEYVAAFNTAHKIHISGEGSLKIRSGRHVVSLNIYGHSESFPTIESHSVDEESLYSKNCIFNDCSVGSKNSHAISGVWWQCQFLECRVSAPTGCGIQIIGDDLTTGNKIINCYFYGCLYGIYAKAGINKPTDMHILHNRFWSGNKGAETEPDAEVETESVTNFHVYLEGSSGTIFNGNHYYGNAIDHFVKVASGGSSVRMTDEYFERNSDGGGALFLAGGNGATYTLSGLNFWCGGNTNPVMTISRNQGNITSFSGCKFYNCNDTKLFLMEGDRTSLQRINWSSDNMIYGTISSDAFADQFIFDDLLTQVREGSDQYETVGLGSFSMFLYQYSADLEADPGAEGLITISLTDDTVNGAKLRVVNDQPTHSAKINLSQTAIDSGFRIVGSKVLLAEQCVDIIVDTDRKICFLK